MKTRSSASRLNAVAFVELWALLSTRRKFSVRDLIELTGIAHKTLCRTLAIAHRKQLARIVHWGPISKENIAPIRPYWQGGKGEHAARPGPRTLTQADKDRKNELRNRRRRIERERQRGIELIAMFRKREDVTFDAGA